MKTKDIPILEKRVLDMLPITQADIWKKLEIGRRDGSGLIISMLKHRLVKRTKIGGGTYLIEKLNGSEHNKETKFNILLSKSGAFSPCCGCSTACDPTKCSVLAEWVL